MSRNEHGQIIFSWRDDVLILDIEGAFNCEGVEYATNQLIKTVDDKGFSKWRRLEILSDEVMGSPEVLKMVKENFHWCERNGCFVTAVVVSSQFQTQVLGDFLGDFHMKLFDDVESARKWLDAQ